MRKFVVLAFCGLCGCSDQLSPVTAPTTTAVSVYATETNSMSVSNRQMYSSEYLIASIYYTNQKCDEFFDMLAQNQQDTNFIDKVLTAAIAAGTPLLASAGVSAKATAAVASSISFANNINKFKSEIYAFAPHASNLRRHVKDQMTIFATKLKADWQDGYLKKTICIGDCTNELERRIYVRGQSQAYANICSLANMRSIVESSLANTQSKCTEKSSTTALADATQSCEAVGRKQEPGLSMINATDANKGRTKK